LTFDPSSRIRTRFRQSLGFTDSTPGSVISARRILSAQPSHTIDGTENSISVNRQASLGIGYDNTTNTLA
jgi:hypothetical protein